MSKVMLSILLVPAALAAQDYVPVGKDVRSALTHNLNVLPANRPAALECNAADIPTINQIIHGTFEAHLRIMSASQAATLGITWAGSASGSVSADQLLAVSDFARSRPCLAKDGQTTLRYGQAIRLVVAMNDYKVTASASIAIVAATATVSGKTNSVDLYTIGFGSPQLQQKLVAAKGLLGGNGLDISSYAPFWKAYTDAEAFAATIVPTADDIDVVAIEQNDDVVLRSAIVTTWALKSVSEGRGCEDAKTRFHHRDANSDAIIANVYIGMSGACGGIGMGTPIQRRAAMLLDGMKVSF